MYGIYALRGCEMQKLTARCVKISDIKLVIIFLEGYLLYNHCYDRIRSYYNEEPVYYCFILSLVISDFHSGFCMTDRSETIDFITTTACQITQAIDVVQASTNFHFVYRTQYIMICFIMNNIRFNQKLFPISTSYGVSLWFAQLYPQ